MAKTTYQCEYCHQMESTLQATQRHEAHCIHNPGVRGCETCGHNIAVFESFCAIEADQGRVDGLTCPEVQGCPSWMPILED